MPFTLAHPAAALPFAKWRKRSAVLSALVIGTMIPDFGYFVPGNWVHAHTHTLASLLWFSLPAGLMVWLLFQLFVKQALIALAPPAIQERLAPLATWPKASTGTLLLLIPAAVLIGAASHLFLDSFTHADGAIARHLPLLRTRLFDLFGRPYTICRLLQHALSLLGIFLLALVIRRWLGRGRTTRSREEQTPWPPWKRAVLAGLIAGPALVATVASGIYLHKPMPVALGVGHGLVLGLETFFLGLLAYSAVWQMRRMAAARDHREEE